MTVAIAHQPPQRLPMSPINANTRRLSARLQKKDASHPQNDGQNAPVAKAASSATSTKRKIKYEEDDDGFTFSRVKKNKKTKYNQDARGEPAMLPVQNEAKVRTASEKKAASPPPRNESESRRRKQRMSFSTPKVRDEVSQRRSKRLSNDTTERAHTPSPTTDHKITRVKRKTESVPEQSISQPKQAHELSQPPTLPTTTNNASGAHSETKIALLTSDTPVIRRNKAMREGKGSRGERRSSLGLRGRRASSLIDTGNSNALPHQEVAISDFYKHIESEQLEPRRMRQLLTWCATRAMHAKPQGSEFDDTHTIMSARAIEEELLKELSNRSDLSDWFARDDAPVVVAELPQRPNPKNLQNADKIAELEQQIQRLRIEKDALQGLLRPPAIAALPTSKKTDTSPLGIDSALLDECDLTALSILESSSSHATGIARRINDITTSLGPSVDIFADGIHKVAQYRSAADELASRILSICADKLARKESDGRRRALQSDVDRHPTQDMSSVLRGLSRVDR